MNRPDRTKGRLILDYLDHHGPSSSYEMARALGIPPRGVSQGCRWLFADRQIEKAAWTVPNPYCLQRAASVWQLTPRDPLRPSVHDQPAADIKIDQDDLQWMRAQRQRAAERVARQQTLGARL